jgi:hypothetical protein
MKIVFRPLESIAETQPQLQPSLSSVFTAARIANAQLARISVTRLKQ